MEESTLRSNGATPPAQIIRLLAEGEKLLGQGPSVEDVARHLEIAESTWHRWQNHSRYTVGAEGAGVDLRDDIAQSGVRIARNDGGCFFQS